MKYLLIALFFCFLHCTKTEVKKQPENLPPQNTGLLIDNSISMMAKDFAPHRITVIKDVIRKMIARKGENQSFALVLFSKNSFVLCPLTADKGKLLSAAGMIDDGILKPQPGTRFYHGLLNGMRILDQAKGARSMILFSDGKETIRSASLDAVLHHASGHHISISSIMMTPKDYAVLPVSMDLNGNLAYTTMKAEPADSLPLKRIASETGGMFRLFYTKKAVEGFDFNRLLTVKRNSGEEKPVPVARDPQMEKLYRQIKISNDSAAADFSK